MAEYDFTDHAWIGPTLVDQSAGTDTNFIPSVPCSVVKVIFRVVETIGAAACVFTIETQQNDGSAQTPTGAAHLGTMTIPIGAAVPAVYYKDLTSSITTAPPILLPGEQLHIDCATVAQAGSGFITVIYRPLPFVDVEQRQDALEPGYTDTSSTLGLVTEVTT